VGRKSLLYTGPHADQPDPATGFSSTMVTSVPGGLAAWRGVFAIANSAVPSIRFLTVEIEMVEYPGLREKNSCAWPPPVGLWPQQEVGHETSVA
jgi:hypothetical protein